jgi:hypothetical protein
VTNFLYWYLTDAVTWGYEGYYPAYHARGLGCGYQLGDNTDGHNFGDGHGFGDGWGDSENTYNDWYSYNDAYDIGKRPVYF